MAIADLSESRAVEEGGAQAPYMIVLIALSCDRDKRRKQW